MRMALLPIFKIRQPQIVFTKMIKKIYIFTLFLLSVTLSSAQFKYAVSVKNFAGLPITGVSVTGINFLNPGITDAAGIYLFETNRDSILLSFSLIGYNTVTEVAKPNMVYKLF